VDSQIAERSAHLLLGAAAEAADEEPRHFSNISVQIMLVEHKVSLWDDGKSDVQR